MCPIYVFTCKGCGTSFDALADYEGKQLVTCPDCKGIELQRHIGAPMFVLKGSGWYKPSSSGPDG